MGSTDEVCVAQQQDALVKTYNNQTRLPLEPACRYTTLQLHDSPSRASVDINPSKNSRSTTRTKSKRFGRNQTLPAHDSESRATVRVNPPAIVQPSCLVYQRLHQGVLSLRDPDHEVVWATLQTRQSRRLGRVFTKPSYSAFTKLITLTHRTVEILSFEN